MSGESLDDHFTKKKKKSTSSKHKPVEEPTKTDDELEIAELKNFDLNSKFGPCYGIGRLERWQRAKELGHDPPERVKQLIENNPSATGYTESLWHSTILTTR